MDWLVRLTYPIFLGIWRRWFGGGLDFLPDNRALKHIVGFCVGSVVLWLYGYTIIQVLLAMITLQAFYWAVGHGCAFDMSRDGYPDKEMIKRYKKYFWNKWCEFLVPKKFWYWFGYDFLWMMFRYGIPAGIISLILWQPYIAFGGITTSLTYAFCWSLSDRGKLGKWFGATGLAEIITGFITGLLLTF